MNWGLFLLNVTLVFLFFESYHAFLYFKSREVGRKGKIRIRVLDIGQENAITLKSLFFRNVVVSLSDHLSERVLCHEEGHVRQSNYIYAFLVVVSGLISLSVFILIPAVMIGKFLFWYTERDADLYAYMRYNMKFESSTTRPVSRVERLKTWFFDSHPPEWVRVKGEYYEKRRNILRLFIDDLVS